MLKSQKNLKKTIKSINNSVSQKHLNLLKLIQLIKKLKHTHPINKRLGIQE